MKLSEGGDALLMAAVFTWLLNTSKPEAYTQGFLGHTQDLPGRSNKMAMGVFAQLERASLDK